MSNASSTSFSPPSASASDPPHSHFYRTFAQIPKPPCRYDHRNRSEAFFSDRRFVRIRRLGGCGAERVVFLPAENLEAFRFLTPPEIFRNAPPNKNANPAQIFSLEKGTLKASGTIPGFLMSKRKFSNYAMTVEYRWLTDSKDRNGGVFVNALETKGNLAAMEVDIPGPNMGHPGRLWVWGRGQKGVTANGKRYVQGEVPTIQGRSLEKPHSEWNIMEVLQRDGQLTIKLNGEVTLKAEKPTPASGAIMVQSGTGAIEFRKLEVIDFGN